MLGLLRLPKEVQDMIINNKLTMGHARALSKLENEEQIIEMANKIVNEKLPVRETEKETNDFEKKIKIRRQKEENKDYRYVEDLLRDKLDTKVKIKDKK